MPAPVSTPSPPRSGLLAISWGVAVLAIYGGVYWFSSGTLQNNSQFNRHDLWISIPELLGELVFPTGEPGPNASPSGWQYFPERLDLLAVAGAILLFAWGWGNCVLGKLLPRGQVTGRLEQLYWSLVVGIAIWGTLTLLLGMCGLLAPIAFWIFGVAPLVVSLVECWKRRKTETDASPTGRVWSALGIVCLVAVIPFLLAMLLGSLQPPNDFDVKAYHLEGAKEYYQLGRIEMLPHNVYTNFPFLTEMLCLSGMVLRGDWFRGAIAGQAVLAAFAPLTALGLFVAARRWLGISAAWFAVLVHLTCPWIYRISIIAYAEGGLACFLFAAFFAALRLMEASDARAARRWTILTGLLAGASAGCKYPAALTVVIPLGILVVVRAHWPVRFVSGEIKPKTDQWARLTFRQAILYSAGVLATFGPWLGKNLCETGNPVYPLLYSVFGGADWDEASNAKWKAGHPLPLKEITGVNWIARDTRDRLWDVFLGSDWQSALYLSAAIAVVFAIWRSRHTKAQRLQPLSLMWLAVSGSLWLFLTWQFFTHRIDRFWVPLLPLLSLLAGAGLAALWEAVEEFMPDRSLEVYWVLRGFVALPVFGVVVFNLALATSPLGGNNSYLMRMQDLQEKTKTPCIAYVESLNLTPTSKVLFVGEAEMFDARFRYEYNTVFDHSLFERDCSTALPNTAAGDQPLKPAKEILDTWHARGVTHIVINWSEILRYRTTYQYTDFVHPKRFQALVDAGVLIPEDRSHLAMLDSLAPEKQQAVKRWAPELILPSRDGQSPVILFEVYRVAE